MSRGGFSPDEMLPVVDRHDRQVGLAPRRRVHAEGLAHRAVHILVFDPRGRLYLQRRSAAKDTYPLYWTSSASGHVDPGESYHQAAVRELHEELGLELELRPVGRIPAGQATDHEFTEVFWAVSAAAPVPDPAEIMEGRFFTWPQAQALAADPARAVPSLAVVLALLAGPPAGGNP